MSDYQLSIKAFISIEFPVTIVTLNLILPPKLFLSKANKYLINQ